MAETVIDVAKPKRKRGAAFMTWIVFASGGSVEDPWEEEKEVEAHDINGAIEASGFEPVNIDGVVNEKLAEDLGLDDEEGEAGEPEEEVEEK